MLPLPLLLKYENVSLAEEDPLSGLLASQLWKQSEVDSWRKWDYQKNIGVPTGASPDIRPWKQLRTGRPYGLSVLIDPNINDYYCPGSDSEGARLTLHSPLESPRVMELSSVIQLGKEILVEVNADITRADPDIRDYSQAKRSCYFGAEKTLKSYRPYTRANCIEECLADYLVGYCGCMAIQFQSYDPAYRNIRICSIDSDEDDACISSAHKNLDSQMEETCGCYPLCEEIKYNHQMSMANLRAGLWENTPDYLTGNWKNHSVAVMHVFFGAERTVPKLRKALYGTADLIGGILGLCLGFSVLSGVELVYFFTLRVFWKRRGGRRRSVHQETNVALLGYGRSKTLFKAKSTKVILVNPEPDTGEKY